MSLLAQASVLLAAFQAVMVARNSGLYNALPEGEGEASLSVLIPARNEERNLAVLLESLRQQRGANFEVVVLDDNSSDGTLAIAGAYAEADARFRVVSAPPLPGGWAGKQHACHLLSLQASMPQWLFLDADVVLTDPRALAKIARHVAASGAAMHSAIPAQLTKTWAERLIIPLIHLVLLGFLPLWEMRRNRMPALGAACGQMVAVKAEAYRRVGGHAAIRHRLHDATALAHLFRAQGETSDLFDATNLAECRMYRSPAEVFTGFGKNATEGMAKPSVLPLWTCLLLGANVLPWWALWVAPSHWLSWVAVGCDVFVYLILMRRFRQNPAGVVLRPLGVLVFIGLQWLALLAKWLGFQASWKGRSYPRTYA